ncbi:hypothetical protein BGZ49_001982 [Haplosporangium sp. Z 27]|nr:hypothetical protein BGZ49_001982 [Haplosporangium sp. Z 27]
MTCYKNTQCVPLTYLCDNTDNPCTDNDGDQDSDNPIPCVDQLCQPLNFLPLPSPGIGKMTGSSRSDCASGSFYSLFGTVPKYTLSCVEPYQSAPVECQAWEYASQSSCFLSTCGTGLDCDPPFFCKTIDPQGLYGICTNPNDTSGNVGNINQAGDGVDNQHLVNHYLIEGLLIGIFCLALGMGIGAGLWHYKRKRINSSWIRPESIRSLRAHSNRGPTWISRLLPFGTSGSPNSNDTAMNRAPTRDSRDSILDSESTDGSFINIGRSSNIVSGRWRWVQGNGRTTRVIGPGGFTVFSEMEAPPLYNNGPDLPKYDDCAEEIVLAPVHDMADIDQPEAPTQAAGSLRSIEPYLPPLTSTLSPTTQGPGEVDASIGMTSVATVPEEIILSTNPPDNLSSFSTSDPSLPDQTQHRMFEK